MGRGGNIIVLREVAESEGVNWAPPDVMVE